MDPEMHSITDFWSSCMKELQGSFTVELREALLKDVKEVLLAELKELRNEMSKELTQIKQAQLELSKNILDVRRDLVSTAQPLPVIQATPGTTTPGPYRSVFSARGTPTFKDYSSVFKPWPAIQSVSKKGGKQRKQNASGAPSKEEVKRNAFSSFIKMLPPLWISLTSAFVKNEFAKSDASVTATWFRGKLLDNIKENYETDPSLAGLNYEQDKATYYHRLVDSFLPGVAYDDPQALSFFNDAKLEEILVHKARILVINLRKKERDRRSSAAAEPPVSTTSTEEAEVHEPPPQALEPAEEETGVDTVEEPEQQATEKHAEEPLGMGRSKRSKPPTVPLASLASKRRRAAMKNAS